MTKQNKRNWADGPRRPKFKPQPISRMLDAYMRGQPGARRARGLAALKQDWADIAGPDFRGLAWPDRIDQGRAGKPGALVLRAAPGAALLLQHESPRLIERVNGYLGANVIGRVRIAPGPMPARRQEARFPPPPLEVDHPRAIALAAKAKGVQSERLAEALTRLGRAIGGGSK